MIPVLFAQFKIRTCCCCCCCSRLLGWWDTQLTSLLCEKMCYLASLFLSQGSPAVIAVTSRDRHHKFSAQNNEKWTTITTATTKTSYLRDPKTDREREKNWLVRFANNDMSLQVTAAVARTWIQATDGGRAEGSELIRGSNRQQCVTLTKLYLAASNCNLPTSIIIHKPS